METERFSGAPGESQPYAETYHVVQESFDRDKEDPDIYDPETGYFRNPTAESLREAVRGNKFYRRDGKPAENMFMYVMDINGEIIFARHANPNNPSKKSPHPTLIGGKDPEVQCSGMIEFRDGRIYAIDNDSCHYRPNIQSLTKAEGFMQKLYDENPLLFHKKSKWRKQPAHSALQHTNN